MWQATVTKARKAWQTVKECACGLFVAALQLTSRPMPKRRQCPGCLRAHHQAGMYCAACEAGLMVRELLRAGAVMASGVVLAACIWMLWR